MLAFAVGSLIEWDAVRGMISDVSLLVGHLQRYFLQGVASFGGRHKLRISLQLLVEIVRILNFTKSLPSLSLVVAAILDAGVHDHLDNVARVMLQIELLGDWVLAFEKDRFFVVEGDNRLGLEFDELTDLVDQLDETFRTDSGVYHVAGSPSSRNSYISLVVELF